MFNHPYSQSENDLLLSEFVFVWLYDDCVPVMLTVVNYPACVPWCHAIVLALFCKRPTTFPLETYIHDSFCNKELACLSQRCNGFWSSVLEENIKAVLYTVTFDVVTAVVSMQNFYHWRYLLFTIVANPHYNPSEMQCIPPTWQDFVVVDFCTTS